MNKVFEYASDLTSTAILAALTSLFLITPTSSSTSKPETVQEQVAYICEALAVDCSSIDHYPQVVATTLNGVYGIYYTQLNDVVFVEGALSPEFQKQVAIHEITHWLDYHLRISPWLETGNGCYTEALAFQVSNLYGLEFGGETVWNWREFYEGC